MGVPEQIITGQSSAPVVKLYQSIFFIVVSANCHKQRSVHIQDSVVIGFWLTHLQTDTHCPIQLPRNVFEQVCADMHHFPTFGDLLRRRQEIRTEWDIFRRIRPDHPTVRAMAAANVDYNLTGYAIVSLCLPSKCQCNGSTAANANLNTILSLWHRWRSIPKSTAPVVVERGLFLQGWLTSTSSYFPRPLRREGERISFAIFCLVDISSIGHTN